MQKAEPLSQEVPSLENQGWYVYVSVIQVWVEGSRHRLLYKLMVRIFAQCTGSAVDGNPPNLPTSDVITGNEATTTARVVHITVAY